MRKISNLIKVNKLIVILVIIVLSILLLAAGLKFIIGYSKSDIVSDLEPTTTIIKVETTNNTTMKKTTVNTTKKTTKSIKKTKINENEMTTYLYQQVIANGWNTNDYNAIVNIIIKESGFNINSVNRSSGACGLFQAYPCKKAIKQYPDYMTNYKSQIDWGINYIKSRYTTPTKAWKFWQEHKWY